MSDWRPSGKVGQRNPSAVWQLLFSFSLPLFLYRSRLCFLSNVCAEFPHIIAFSLAELSAGIGQKPLTESEAQLSVRSPGSGPQQGNSGERQPASSPMKQAESGCSTTEGWVSHLASLSWKWLAAPKHNHLLDNYPAPEPFKIQWRRPNVAVTVNQAQPPPKWNDLLMPRCREGL